MVQSGTNRAARPLRTGRVGRLLGLLCVVAPILVAEARGTLPARAVATRFSSLSELTPRNVRGLMPLAVLPLEVGPPDDATGTDPTAPGRAARLGSLAAGDERLRGFVSWRVALNGGGAAVSTGSHDNGVAVSLVAAPASAAGLSGALAAWDASRSRLVWAAGKPAARKSGALVTAGGLVLYCSADGWFNVLDVTSGRELWRHRLSGGERATPVSYLGPDGHQFVAVLTEQRGHRPTLQPFSLPR